jgi:hypothetical protein
MFACQFDNNLFALLLFEGICLLFILKRKYIAMYNELSSELVYRIELLQRASLELVRNELNEKTTLK